MYFFRQFEDHNTRRKHGNYSNNTIFFHLPFLLYLLVTFISEFENSWNSFSNPLLQSILAFKTPQFLQKLLIWTVHQTFPESIDTLRLPKIYIMFSLPAGAKYSFFLRSSSWTISDVEENIIQRFSAFLLVFWWQKNKGF